MTSIWAPLVRRASRASAKVNSNERRLRRLVTESKCAIRSITRSAFRLAVTSWTTTTHPPLELGVSVTSRTFSFAVSNCIEL